MARTLRTTEGFFISQFGERHRFVYPTLSEHVDDLTRNIGRPVRLVKIDEAEGVVDLVDAIRSHLNAASFAICDITPEGTQDDPQWNPNVFYELGIATQLGMPVFLICDGQRRPKQTGPRLPFDIASKLVYFYDFTPKGLAELRAEFARWLGRELDAHRGSIGAYQQTQSFVAVARRIKSEMYRWRGGSHAPSFRQLLARLAGTLDKEVTQMAAFLDSLSGGVYRFEPHRRAAAIEHLFVATIESLERGDEYHTLSSLPFWMSFNDNGAAFREACVSSARDGGVVIKRLLFVPKTLTSEEEDIVNKHKLAAESAGPSYELRISAIRREDAMSPKGHIGVCHRKALGVITAFEPAYGGKPKSKGVVAIRVRADAEDAAREFMSRWAATPVLSEK